MAVNFSGIGSGTDFGPLIDKLVAAERLPIRAFVQKKQDTSKQLSTVSDLASKLSALKTAMANLNTQEDLRSFKATSSDETRLKVSATGAASAGTYQITVPALARAQVNQSFEFGNDDAGVVGVGTLGIRVGTDDPVTLHFDTQDNLSSLAKKINDSAARVSASVLFDGSQYRLLVTADETGTANAVTFTEGGDQLGFLDPATELTAARNSTINVNGIPVTRSSNKLTDVLPGVTIDLVSETPIAGAATELNIAPDPAGLESRVKTFVDAYNGVIKILDSQLGASKETRAQETLQGDSSIRFLQSRLQRIITEGHDLNDEPMSLGLYGVQMNDDGTLQIDSAKLASAMADNPQGLDAIFLQDIGLSDKLTALIDEYTLSGDGILSQKQTNLRQKLEGFDEQIDRVEARAAKTEAQLRAQFAALDSLMVQLNTQSSALSGLFTLR